MLQFYKARILQFYNIGTYNFQMQYKLPLILNIARGFDSKIRSTI